MRSKFCISFAFLYSSILFGQSLPIRSNISLLVEREISVKQNLIGLDLIELKIINNTNEVILLNPSNRIFFEADFGANRQKVSFDEGNAILSSVSTEKLGPIDTIKAVVNLNLLGLYHNYKYKFKETLEFNEPLSVRIGIYCQSDKKFYYSNPFNIMIDDFSDQNREAYYFIEKEGFSTDIFSSRGKITAFRFDIDLIESLIAKYPESTFAELASLSLAYQRARETKTKPELKYQVNQLLEKPLKSKYSFVQYLAEALEKKL